MRLPILTESCKRNRRKTLGHDPLFFTRNFLLKSIFSLDEGVRSLTQVKISQEDLFSLQIESELAEKSIEQYIGLAARLAITSCLFVTGFTFGSEYFELYSCTKNVLLDQNDLMIKYQQVRNYFSSIAADHLSSQPNYFLHHRHHCYKVRRNSCKGSTQLESKVFLDRALTYNYKTTSIRHWFCLLATIITMRFCAGVKV